MADARRKTLEYLGLTGEAARRPSPWTAALVVLVALAIGQVVTRVVGLPKVIGLPTTCAVVFAGLWWAQRVERRR